MAIAGVNDGVVEIATGPFQAARFSAAGGNLQEPRLRGARAGGGNRAERVPIALRALPCGMAARPRQPQRCRSHPPPPTASTKSRPSERPLFPATRNRSSLGDSTHPEHRVTRKRFCQRRFDVARIHAVTLPNRRAAPQFPGRICRPVNGSRKGPATRCRGSFGPPATRGTRGRPADEVGYFYRGLDVL